MRQSAAEYLDNLLDIESKRRPVDAGLRSPIVDGRDVLLCAATNLESPYPQSQPSVAAKLRAVADLLVELDMDRSALHTLRSVLRLGRAPQLRRIAKTLEHIADDFPATPPASED